VEKIIKMGVFIQLAACSGPQGTVVELIESKEIGQNTARLEEKFLTFLTNIQTAGLLSLCKHVVERIQRVVGKRKVKLQ
jgi:hypothetical protein